MVGGCCSLGGPPIAMKAVTRRPTNFGRGNHLLPLGLIPLRYSGQLL